MRICYLQHVPHEGPGTIADWAAARGIELQRCLLYRGATVPAVDAADALVVMGGPMSIHDEAEHPWLVPEKRALRAWIDSGKPVLGVCLGGQLLAHVLGAGVGPNPRREIGWFPVRLQPPARRTPLADLLPDEMDVFHWHGETFAIPAGAVPLMSSAACDNQGFLYGERVLGLQCHLEVDEATVRAFIDNSDHQHSAEPYVQSPEAMLAHAGRFEAMRERLCPLLDWWAGAG